MNRGLTLAAVLLLGGCTSDSPEPAPAASVSSSTSTTVPDAASAWGHRYVLDEATINGNPWSPGGGRELRVEMRSGLSMRWGVGCNEAHSVRSNEDPSIIDQRWSRELQDCGSVVNGEEDVVNTFMTERLSVTALEDGSVRLESTETDSTMNLDRSDWETLHQEAAQPEPTT
ncbi:MAG: hypothetical protein GY708_30145 [Actinomycetia bacterium]|nr:hypothetical protein [Actinomycetes bacterium]